MGDAPRDPRAQRVDAHVDGAGPAAGDKALMDFIRGSIERAQHKRKQLRPPCALNLQRAAIQKNSTAYSVICAPLRMSR